MTIASYPEYLRLVPKKPFACVEVGPFVPAPIVTTVRPLEPQAGSPAIGPVARIRRLSGWSQAPFPFPPAAADSHTRTLPPGPPPPDSPPPPPGPPGPATASLLA